MDRSCTFAAHSHLHEVPVQVRIAYLPLLDEAEHQFKVGGNGILEVECAETLEPNAFGIECGMGGVPPFQEGSALVLRPFPDLSLQ